MKTNFNAGFSVLGLVLGMVAVLAIGGGAGYMYLNSIKGETVQESQKLADFSAGGAVNDNAPSNKNSEIGSKIGGLLSGEKNCGNINMSEYLKDPLNYKPEVFSCYGQALYDCSPAKMTFDEYEYKVEGKSGTNCVVSDSGAYDGVKKVSRGPLSCSFSIEAPLAFSKLSATKDDAFYKKVWMLMSGATLNEGVNTIPLTSASATCTLK